MCAFVVILSLSLGQVSDPTDSAILHIDFCRKEVFSPSLMVSSHPSRVTCMKVVNGFILLCLGGECGVQAVVLPFSSKHRLSSRQPFLFSVDKH